MQARLEEERKRQERLRTEKNALYNRQRLDMEAQNFALLGSGEEQRGARLASTASAAVVTDVAAAEPMSPRERAIVDRLKEQDKLREEHKREETQIREEFNSLASHLNLRFSVAILGNSEKCTPFHINF